MVACLTLFKCKGISTETMSLLWNHIPRKKYYLHIIGTLSFFCKGESVNFLKAPTTATSMTNRDSNPNREDDPQSNRQSHQVPSLNLHLKAEFKSTKTQYLLQCLHTDLTSWRLASSILCFR